MVLTILKNIDQWEGLSHVLWKIKHVPSYQPENYLGIVTPTNHHLSIEVSVSFFFKYPNVSSSAYERDDSLQHLKVRRQGWRYVPSKNITLQSGQMWPVSKPVNHQKYFKTSMRFAQNLYNPLPCRVARPKEYMGQLQTPWHGRVFNRKKWDFNSQMSDINNE